MSNLHLSPVLQMISAHMKSQLFFLLQCDESVPPPPAKDPSNYPVTAIISTWCAGRNSGQGGNWVPRFPLFIEVIGTSVRPVSL